MARVANEEVAAGIYFSFREHFFLFKEMRLGIFNESQESGERMNMYASMELSQLGRIHPGILSITLTVRLFRGTAGKTKERAKKRKERKNPRLRLPGLKGRTPSHVSIGASRIEPNGNPPHLRDKCLPEKNKKKNIILRKCLEYIFLQTPSPSPAPLVLSHRFNYGIASLILVLERRSHEI